MKYVATVRRTRIEEAIIDLEWDNNVEPYRVDPHDEFYPWVEVERTIDIIRIEEVGS